MPHALTLSNLRVEAVSLWKLAWPMLIGQLATVGMGVADVAMTGHTSADELAAVSLGASIWSIILVTVSGTMMAINSIAAHDVGAGQLHKVPHVVRQALWKSLGVGVVAMLLANLATLLFDHLYLAPHVQRQAELFVHIISLGLPPFAAYRALYGYSTSINQTRPVMLIAILGLAINVFVNWLLVFGNWGMPALGGVGCAVSTALCMWVMLFAMLAWIRHAPAYRATYPLGQWEAPHWPQIGAMLRLGVPIGISYFAEVSAFGAVSLLVARYGVVEISSHQIALNFTSLVFMVPLSFGMALITRVGQSMGEGNPAQARFISWVGVWMSLAFAVLSALFIVVFRDQIARAYTSDPAVQQLCAHLLLFAALFQLSDSTQVVAACALRGYKISRQPMQIQVLAFWGFALPIGCWLGLAPQWSWLPWTPAQPMAAAGFWIGLVIGLTVAAVLLSWALQRLSLARVKEAGGMVGR
ncbi:MAG: MATE family efflux transporter [Duganella sp.]